MISVLVVDDSVVIRRLIVELLDEVPDIRVVGSAANGRLALQKIDQLSPDVVTMDIEMPEMDGLTAVRELRKKPAPLRHLPVVVLTGYSHLRNVTAVRDAGAHGVLKKPVSPQCLYDHIAWAAQPNRSFVETETYVGPDRRFKFMGPPNGVGRRASDLTADIGEATEPNLSQDEIDAMIRPTRVVTA